MADLCIQVHPHRSPDLNLAAVRVICERIAGDDTLVQNFAVVDGTDGHDYVNLMFGTDQLEALWNLLQRHLYEHEEVGVAMQMSSMAMCEGTNGWDDYLLLRHFDPKCRVIDAPEQAAP
jgi:hypothetical protein